jgi:hypothetical protein
MKLDGYVIVPPLNKEHLLEVGHRSFGRIPYEAWYRFTRYPDDLDRTTKIQRWFDKGYRVKQATLEIHDE